KEKAAEYLRERPELMEEIRAKVLERAGEVVLAASEEEGE
ncbi:MAG: DNA recombination/repair protein RecA, partial [Thermus sp.]|nr:DNA recombination/repair protein RecA [Thermus sp.]